LLVLLLKLLLLKYYQQVLLATTIMQIARYSQQLSQCCQRPNAITIIRQMI